MKRVLSFILAVSMLAAIGICFPSCSGGEKYTIGICQQMPHVALDSATQGFMDALIAEFGEENLEFIVQNAQGETTACTTIANDFVTKNVDLILGNATTALQACANATETIPVLGTSVTEYGVALGIENFNGLVGTNVSGASDLAPLDSQAAIVTTFFPDAKNIGLLYCSAEPNSDYQVKKVQEYLEAAGLTCTKFPFTDSNDVTTVSAAAAAASDVIYIPTDNTAANCAEAINGAVLPTGTPIVGGDAGICGGCGVITHCIDYYDLGVATGKMAVQILKGEKKVSEMEIQYAETYSKVYNETNCKELGIDIEALKAAGYTALED